jgi:hypothetical protein
MLAMAALCAFIGRLLARRSGTPEKLSGSEPDVGGDRPADMNHRLARQRADDRREPAPVDFRGAAHAAWSAAR